MRGGGLRIMNVDDEVGEEKIEDIVIRATDEYRRIVSTREIKETYPRLYWGGNGLGDRLARKKFNYTVLYPSYRYNTYSENEEDEIPVNVLEEFYTNRCRDDGVDHSGIIGIFVHSRRQSNQIRPINKKIQKEITKRSCVICGTYKTICDHKNDLYNDNRVLRIETQLTSDFQPLCNHCNLQKRQVCKTEKQNKKLYSAKNIERYKVYDFEFPWEKKAFDISDIHCKEGTYWFDPVEFEKKIHYYSTGVLPVIKEIKYKIKTNKLLLFH